MNFLIYFDKIYWKNIYILFFYYYFYEMEVLYFYHLYYIFFPDYLGNIYYFIMIQISYPEISPNILKFPEINLFSLSCSPWKEFPYIYSLYYNFFHNDPNFLFRNISKYPGISWNQTTFSHGFSMKMDSQIFVAYILSWFKKYVGQISVEYTRI